MKKGTKHSPETVAKMRLAKLGKTGNNKGKSWKQSAEAVRHKSERMKGRTFTPEHRANLKKSRAKQIPPLLGKKRPPFSEEWRKNISRAKRGMMMGEAHPNWKGNSAEQYRERRRFKTIQKEVMARDNYTCQICFVRGGYLQVDHIKSWSKYPELRFELDNCRTLCMACHYYVTFKRKMPDGIIWGHNFSKRVA